MPVTHECRERGPGPQPAHDEPVTSYRLVVLTGPRRIGKSVTLIDTAAVRDLIAGAGDAAQELGGDFNRYWTTFGPTNVRLHRAAAAVELGDGRVAVDCHEQVAPESFAATPPAQRAHHFLNLARDYTRVGNIEKASEMLLEGEQLAPAEVRCRPLAHEVLSDVLRRTRGTPQPLSRKWPNRWE